MTLRDTYLKARDQLEHNPFLTITDRQRMKVLFQYIEALERSAMDVDRQIRPVVQSLVALTLREAAKKLPISKAELEVLPDTLNLQIESSEEGYTVVVHDGGPDVAM